MQPLQPSEQPQTSASEGAAIARSRTEGMALSNTPGTGTRAITTLRSSVSTPYVRTTIHDPLFDVPARPLYRWGASPFRLRGLVYRDSLVRAEQLLAARGLTTLELLRRTGDARFEEFMGQHFTATAWYDIYPSIHFGPLVARTCGVGLAAHMKECAAVHAQWAVAGYSGVALKTVSAETVAAWLPQVSAWYNEFGGLEARATGAASVRGVRTGVPVFAVQSWGAIAMHFTERVLEGAGVRDPRAVALEVEPDGERFGCSLWRVAFEVTWAE